MTKYTIEFSISGWHTIEVEADSEEEALTSADEELRKQIKAGEVDLECEAEDIESDEEEEEEQDEGDED